MSQPLLARSLAIRRVVAQAFVDDPLLEWIFPDASTRLECTAAWMGLFVEEYLLHCRVDTVEVGGEVVAAALWRIPNAAPMPYPELPSIPGLLGALVGSERQLRLGQAMRALSAAHPSYPYAYLQFLAVAPSHQGRRLGREVVQPGLDAASDARLPAYLETTNRRNLSFYLSMGFEVTNHFTLDDDGPETWCLARSVPSSGAAPSR